MKVENTWPTALPSTDVAGDFWFDEASTEFRLATGSVCLSPQPELSVIRITGVDALAFLHGQLITNLHKLIPGQGGALSGWCTPQGRIAFLFHLLRITDGFLLIIPASESARLLQRLRMFVLRAEVLLEELTHWSVLGLSLPDAAQIPTALAVLPRTRNAQSQPQSAIEALCIDASCRYLVCGETALLMDWWRTLAVPVVGSAAWRWLDIQQGLPRITGTQANTLLPQQLNLDMVDALAFDKGCYPGQEIIARLKYRGEVKSRLLRGQTTGKIEAGIRLLTTTGHVAGHVLSVVTTPAGTTDLLAVVELSALDTAPQPESGPVIDLLFSHPPYWSR